MCPFVGIILPEQLPATTQDVIKRRRLGCVWGWGQFESKLETVMYN